MYDSQMRSPTPALLDRRLVDQTSHLDWKLLPPDRLELARKFLSDIPLYMESVSPLYWSSDRFYLWLQTYSYSTLAKKATFTPEMFIEAWTSALAVLYSFPPYGIHPDEIALAYYREMRYQQFHVHLLHQLRNSRCKVGWWCCPREAEAHPDDYTTSSRRDPAIGISKTEMSQSGQILYLGSSNTNASGGGSLSTRQVSFQKLAQSRGGGITIVNQPTSLESRPGRSLGLGQGTGSRPTGNGQRITTGSGAARGGRSRNAGAVQGSAAGGLHTASGLARAMQERGGGVSDEFLFAPAAFVAGSGGPSSSTRGGRNGRGGGALRGAGGARQQQQQGLSNNRATNHKALALGQRPGRRQNVAQVPQAQQQQQQQGGRGRNGRGANNGAAQAQAQGKKGKGATAKSNGPAGKQNKKGKANQNANSLDSELSEYMMKDHQTAASALDNDLDSYMAEKPEETTCMTIALIKATTALLALTCAIQAVPLGCTGNACYQAASSGNVNLGSATNIFPITQVTPITRYQPIVQGLVPIVQSECFQGLGGSAFGSSMLDLGLHQPLFMKRRLGGGKKMLRPDCVPSAADSCETSLVSGTTELGSSVIAVPSNMVLPSTVYQGRVQSQAPQVFAAPAEHTRLGASNVDLGSSTLIQPTTHVIPNTVYQPSVENKGTIIESEDGGRSLARSSVELGSQTTIRPTTYVEPLTVIRPKIQTLPADVSELPSLATGFPFGSLGAGLGRPANTFFMSPVSNVYEIEVEHDDDDDDCDAKKAKEKSC
ncbi:hypothetical protein CPC16_008896 [Podila verticillata]|nr:hypothetical protein CPC16_008896 [Podila verticillata]